MEFTTKQQNNDSNIDSNIDSNNMKINTKIILLYAISSVAALGFNDLIITIVGSFKWNTHLISKIIYVIIMFVITIGLAYYLNLNLHT